MGAGAVLAPRGTPLSTVSFSRAVKLPRSIPRRSRKAPSRFAFSAFSCSLAASCGSLRPCRQAATASTGVSCGSVVSAASALPLRRCPAALRCCVPLGIATESLWVRGGGSRQPWRKQREALTAIVSTMQCASAARDELRFAHVCVLAKPMGRSRGMGGVFASRTTAEAELIWRRAERTRKRGDPWEGFS